VIRRIRFSGQTLPLKSFLKSGKKAR